MGVVVNSSFVEVPAGYTVRELIADGAQTRLYRATRDADGVGVILKTLRERDAGGDASASIHNEYEILTALQAERIIQAFGLEQLHNLPVLVLEDIGGESLERISARRTLPLDEVLTLGAEIARALAELHAAKIIHKDINPSNVILNERTGVLKVIDFGIATRLSQEYASVAAAQGDPATLAYMSPEQTGRMNRAVDYRTDFYSLGALLYELLTGHWLFDVAEPIEWFHAHIAKQPKAPAVIDPAIPQPVSEIVMKLLAKTPEHRYQSALGVYHDLQVCLAQWREMGRIESLPLAVKDVPAQFHVPQRLYGREQEVTALLEALEQARGQVSVALVAGRSGVGKSRLINELYKPVTARQGYFIFGKFDQMHRDVPYSGLAGALNDLIQQLLTESAERLADWKAKILAAVGTNVRLVIDLVPELELIVGPQPDVPALPLLESEQRFHITLVNFIQVFSSPDQPLVLVIDDLQWADSGTLKLADLLVEQVDGDSLLVVGAYRDDEVLPGHPLLEAFAKLREHQVPISTIELEPLQVPDICVLLAEALWSDTGRVEPLAQLIKEKTDGNPFFIDEFLRDLHRQGLIAFDAAAGSWDWDLERIRAQKVTDNLVDLMSYRLQRLPDETQQLLKLAACAGTRFSLSLLAVMAERPPRDVARGLRDAVDQGLVSPVTDAYQLVELQQGIDLPELTVEFAFAHDRILQGAYELLEPSRREATHLAIGRLLLAGLSPSERNKHLFSIVKHFNAAEALIHDGAERHQLCHLNLEAARRARDAASYHIAFDHYSKSLALLDDNAWQDDYALARDLHQEAAEAAVFIGRDEALDPLVDAGLAHARNLVDRVPFYEARVSQYTYRGELRAAVDLAKPVLAQLGHPYPNRPRKLHVVLRLLALKRRLRKWSVTDLRELQPMTDPQQLAAERLGGSIGTAAMFAQPLLLPLMVIHSMERSLDYGMAPQTGTSFIVLGMIYAQSLGEVDRGMAYAQLGLEHSRKIGDSRYLGRALHIYPALVQHWKEPLRDTLDGLREAFRVCMQNGDLEYAVHAATIYAGHAFFAGMSLDSLEREMSADLMTFKALQQGNQLEYLQIHHQVVHNLRGEAPDPSYLAGQAYDIDVVRPLESQAENHTMVLHAAANAFYLAYAFGEDERALAYAKRFEAEFEHESGFHKLLWAVFHVALVWLRAADRAEKGQRRRYLRKVSTALKQLKRFARDNPATCLARLYLVQAEWCRVMGRDFDAHAEFDRAIANARENGMLNEQALGNELCGAMHMAAGRDTLGIPYLREAWVVYQRWGAVAKVDDIVARYPQAKPESRSTGMTTGTMAPNNIDINSLMKALKAVADEPVHSRMVGAIVQVALEFAGAQRGVLALRNPQGELCIEAEAAVDGGEPTILQSQPLTDSDAVSTVVVNYVTRTRNSVVVADAAEGSGEIPGLERDEHVLRDGVRSILCLPVMAGAGKDAELIGLIYLENNHTSNCFTDERFSMLEIIGVAAAGRLELSRKAAVDGLTDLFNHDYFKNMLKQEVAVATRRRRELSVIMLDIDHFKGFNDTWGHQLGDRVLQDVAGLLKSGSREGDTAARYGGEEMAVILPDTGLEEAVTVAERLRRSIAEHAVDVKGQSLSVTASLGVAAVHADGDAEALVRRADEALYRAKANGRNQVVMGD